ncbi:MAG TPA: cyanophycinase [Kofleriaceae bacterium]|jgi:cyanophycinase
MRWRRATLLAACALAALGVGGAPARAQSLVVIGGGLDDPAIYDRIIELGGGPGKARIGILTTGSGTPEEGARLYVDAFAARGGKAEWLPLTSKSRKGAEDPALVAQAAQCNVFFLGGGDQRRYTRALLRRDGSDTALLEAIRRAYESGGVVAGTSAGAAVLVSAPMVTGGESYDALARPRRVTDRLRGGLRFFRFGLIDTHFGERGRQGRIIRLAARRRAQLAFGVDEDTALVVTGALGPRPAMEVVGKGGVSVFDTTRARVSWRGRWRIENLRSHYLVAGDSFSVKDRRFRARAGRARDDAPIESEVGDRGDLFSAVDPKARKRLRPRSFIRTAQSAMSGGSAATSGHPAEDAAWRVTLRRGRGAARYRGGSYRNLRIDIRRR